MENIGLNIIDFTKITFLEKISIVCIALIFWTIVISNLLTKFKLIISKTIVASITSTILIAILSYNISEFSVFGKWYIDALIIGPFMAWMAGFCSDIKKKLRSENQ